MFLPAGMHSQSSFLCLSLKVEQKMTRSKYSTINCSAASCAIPGMASYPFRFKTAQRVNARLSSLQTQKIFGFGWGLPSANELLEEGICEEAYNRRGEIAINMVQMNNSTTLDRSLAKRLLPHLEILSNIQYLLSQETDEQRAALLERGDEALRSMVKLVNEDLGR